MACDVNGEDATMLLYGTFDCVSIAGGVLYAGSRTGYTQQVRL